MGESSDQAASSDRRYSIEELIRLRTSASFVLLNLDNLSTDAEASTILNLPEQAKENRHFRIRTSELANMKKRAPLVERPGNNSTSRRGGSQSINASGVEEEEDRVIYRGHPSRKDIRETQWHLRRRDASDRSSQPVDAPTDILAQKDDNFKAFFQAVRSPTHVRVTAGGRIVPNTRGHPPPQPVFKWNHEQQFFEQTKRQSSPDGQAPVFYQEGVALPPAGIFSTAGSSYFNGQPIVQAPGAAGDNNATENTPMQSSTTVPAGTEGSSANAQRITNHQGIQISPPENFDLTRPYWFHDRWIFPQGSEAAQQQHMLPAPLAGNQGMMHPMFGYMPGAFAQQVGPQGMYFTPNHVVGMHQPGQQLQYAYPPMMYPGQQPLGNIVNGMPVQPPASGVPLFAPQLIQYVEDPKQRLARCREDLKKIENDLQHNAHQIDRPSRLAQRSQCLAEIQRLEAVINHSAIKQNQLAAGSGQLSRNSVRKGSSTIETSSRNSQTPAIVDSNVTTSLAASLGKSHIAPKSTDQLAQHESDNGSHEKLKADPQVEASAVQDKSSNRAKLAAAAATAVFQPRSHQLPKLQTGEEKDAKSVSTPSEVSNQSKAVSDQSKAEKAKKDKEEEEKLLANAFDWSIPASMMTGSYLGAPPAPYSHVGPASLAKTRHNAPAMVLPKMVPYQTVGIHVPAAPRAMMPSHTAGAPYLRGIQPLANGEYTYERQLTPDEIHARALYFGGKGSREVNRGLPKYNGRDFYPPSPVKSSSMPSQFRGAARQSQMSDPFQDFDYSRTNSGPKENGNNEDIVSRRSWADEMNPSLKSKNISPAHTLPRMKGPGRDSRFAGGAGVSAEEDQGTAASDRQSIGRGKRTPVENKGSSSSFLQDMLKSGHFTSSYGTSLNTKEPSSDSVGGKSQPFEDKIRVSTPLGVGSMAAPLSGTITSATAQGVLPQYRGSATASLAPNSESPDGFGSKLFGRFSSNSDVQEQQSPPRVSRNEETRMPPSRLAAAEYLRSLANKEQREEHKTSSTISDTDKNDMGASR